MAIPTTKKERGFKEPSPDYLKSFGFSFLRNLFVFAWFILMMFSIVIISPYIFKEGLSLEVRLLAALLVIFPVGIMVVLYEPLWRGIIDEEELKRDLK